MDQEVGTESELLGADQEFWGVGLTEMRVLIMEEVFGVP